MIFFNKQDNTSKTQALLQIQKEMKLLENYCKKNDIPMEDLEQMLEPIIEDINRVKRFRKYSILLILLSLFTVIYVLSYIEIVSWYLTAIGRILLIQMLPVWNWPVLKNADCLIEINNKPPIFNTPCELCEAIDKIPVEVTDDEDVILKRYIELDVPVVVQTDLKDWPLKQLTSLHNLTKVISDKKYLESRPCKISSNLISKERTVEDILKKAVDFGKFFVHFQNCNYDAMKRFRMYSPKPKFLHAKLSPVQYNWILISRNYNVAIYKKLDMLEKINVVVQVLGSIFLRLKPLKDCELSCPIIEVELKQGEALVLTDLWYLEYKPFFEGDNLSIILELH